MIKSKKSAITRVAYSVAVVTFIFYINDCFNSENVKPTQKMDLSKSNVILSDKAVQPKVKQFIEQESGLSSTEINRSRTSQQKQSPLYQHKTAQFNSSPTNFSFFTVNSYDNYELDENVHSSLQENDDLIDLLDGEVEETIAYAFDIGLELNFSDVEEELNDDISDSNNEIGPLSVELDPLMLTDPNYTSFETNQLSVDIFNKILSPDSNFEHSLEYIKQLASLALQQSESEELIIMTLNDLTEDADYSISDAAFEGLETLIATQQNESGPNIEMENDFSDNESY